MTTGLSDAQMIDNLFTDTPLDTVKFNDAQWAYLTDINGQAYQDRIIFNTTVLKQQLVDFFNAFITIPITVTRSQLPTANVGLATATDVANAAVTCPFDYVNTQVDNSPGSAGAADPFCQTSYRKGPAANETLLAFRDSILNLFSGLILQTDNGQAIVNENGYLDFINNLRLKIENSIDWAQSMASLLHFSLDTVPFSNQSVNQSCTTLPVDAAGNPSLSNSSVNPFLPDTYLTSGKYSGYPASGTTLPSNSVVSQTYISANDTVVISALGVITVTLNGSPAPLTNAMVGGIITLTSGANSALQFIITKVNSTTVAEIAGVYAAGPTAAASYTIQYDNGGFYPATVPVPNPGFNKGLWDRIQIFHNSSTFVPRNGNQQGSYSLVLKIPLRLLHDVLNQIDFPLINVGLNLQLLLRQSHNSSPLGTPANPPNFTGNIPPLQTGTLIGANGTTGYATWAGGLPALTYGSLAQGVSGTMSLYGTGCRLYYRSIKLNPAENEIFRERLARGFTKKIKFISTDYFRPSQMIGTSTYNGTIAQSIVWPMRVWVLLYSANNQTTQTANQSALGGNYVSTVPSATATGIAPTNGLQVVHGWIKNANIWVNNQQYFKNNLQTVDDFWCQFKDQMDRNTGCMISYQDYCKLFRYPCFDISRLSDRLPSKTESVSLQLSFDRADQFTASNCDMIVLIERMNQIQFDFASSDVTITVGNITA